jgi:hypothetical protein
MGNTMGALASTRTDNLATLTTFTVAFRRLMNKTVNFSSIYETCEICQVGAGSIDSSAGCLFTADFLFVGPR